MEQEIQNPQEKEPREKAVAFLFATLDRPVSKLEEFPEQLNEEIENLDRYKDIFEQVKELPKEELPLAIFHLIKRTADVNANEQKGNGVLIDSMKAGNLECAGRTMIVSRLFENLNVDHRIAKPYGHSMILFEQDEDTVVYFDANNNLYFTFPRSALKGYTGDENLQECWLEDYQPREKDTYHGGNSVMRHMMVMNPHDGILQAYLNNAGAALNGNKEFKEDEVKVDKASAEAMHEVKAVLLGGNQIPDEFYVEGEKEFKASEEEKKFIKQQAMQMYNDSTSKEEFAKQLLTLNKLWESFPYMHSENDRTNKAYDWYEKLSSM